MHGMLDDFASEVRNKRTKLNCSQRKLAERLHMSVRTILELENGKSNPKAETVFLIAKELNISIDAILFPEILTENLSKTLIDYFKGKNESEIQKYISICKAVDQLNNSMWMTFVFEFDKISGNMISFYVQIRIKIKRKNM